MLFWNHGALLFYFAARVSKTTFFFAHVFVSNTRRLSFFEARVFVVLILKRACLIWFVFEARVSGLLLVF